MLSLLIYLFPSLYGEGYDLITLLLNGNGQADWDTAMDRSLFYGSNYLLVYLFLIVIFKQIPNRARLISARTAYLKTFKFPLSERTEILLQR